MFDQRVCSLDRTRYKVEYVQSELGELYGAQYPSILEYCIHEYAYNIRTAH